MPAPVYKTKGELRAILLARLGFGGLGAGAGKFVPYADDLLVEAQEQIYELLPDEKRNTKFQFNTVIAPTPELFYDIPTTLDPEHIDAVNVFLTNAWQPMTQGITYPHDSIVDTESYPSRYDLKYNTVTSRAQIEIWPKPDAVYPISIEGQLQVSAFVADGDKSSMDYRLILLYAIAFGKAHLGRKDAKSAMDAWTTRLHQIVGNQHGTRRYIRGQHEAVPEPKPRVV